MKNVVITGANRGIGLALCEQFKAAGDHVIAVCREASDDIKALEVEIIDGIDVTDPAAVQELVKKLNSRSIDVLIHNAGVMTRNELGHIDYPSISQQYQVNAVAPLLITEHLLPFMKSGSKLGIVTSRMGSLADNDSGSHYGYRMSKAAANMLGVSLSVDLKPKGIAVMLLHPGYVKTDMTGQQGYVDTDHAAKGLFNRIADLSMENTGTFWHADGEQLPW